MTDIVERLRRIARGYEPTDMGVSVNMDEAAAAIEALRAANAEMREDFEEIQRLMDSLPRSATADAVEKIATAALARKP